MRSTPKPPDTAPRPFPSQHQHWQSLTKRVFHTLQKRIFSRIEQFWTQACWGKYAVLSHMTSFPPDCFISPKNAANREDLPEPTRPTTATSCSGATSSCMSCKNAGSVDDQPNLPSLMLAILFLVPFVSSFSPVRTGSSSRFKNLFILCSAIYKTCLLCTFCKTPDK